MSIEISSTTDIPDPPEKVWSVLVDFADYPAWTSQLTINGQARVGSRLRVGMGDSRMAFHSRVTTATPGRELRWVGKLGPSWMLRGEHYFRLEPTPNGTRLHHGEVFTGALTRLTGSAGKQSGKDGYSEFGRALGHRVAELR